MKRLLYFAIFVSPMGATALALDTPIGRMSLFRIAILAAVLGLFIPTISKKDKYLIYKRENKFSVSFMLIWLVWAVISVIWSQDYADWFKYIYFLFVGVICIFLFNNYLGDMESIRNAFRALAWGITVQAGVGWYEVITCNYCFGFWEGEYFVSKHLRIPIAMSGNSNDFAVLMFLGVFVAYICFACSESKMKKIIYAIMTISHIVLLCLSTSRSVLLGFVLSMVFVWCLGGKKRILILCIMAVGILLCPLTRNYLMGHINLNFSEMNSDSIRLNLIRNGFLMLGDTFGLGVGAGQIEYWLNRGVKYDTGEVVILHNWWIEILSSYGIFIFVGYLVFYVKLFFSNFRKYMLFKGKNMGTVGISICAFMVGYIASSLAASSNMTNECLWAFWAICIAYQGIKCSSTVDDIAIGG